MINQLRSAGASAPPAAANAQPQSAETCGPQQELALFRLDFYADLAKVVHHVTVINSAVQVSDEALAAMQEDPAYRQQMLDLVARDLGSSYAPRPASVHIRIGPTADDYRADSWPVGYDDEFHARIRGSEADSRRQSRSRRQLDFDARRHADYRARQKALQESSLRRAAMCTKPRRSGSAGALEPYLNSSTSALLSSAESTLLTD